jgi:hypothetical protein
MRDKLLDAAKLVRLQAAFPEFSFGICPGWRATFEADSGPRSPRKA